MNNQSQQGANRNEEHRGPQQEEERQGKAAQERGAQRQGPPDTHELDKKEGNMDHGELGGNLREEE